MTFDSLTEGDIAVDVMETEDEKKIAHMIENIFPGAKTTSDNGKLTAPVSLTHFRELVDREEIRPAVEAALDSNAEQGRSFIDLNKIAALAGRIGLSEQAPIGKIRLIVPWERA